MAAVPAAFPFVEVKIDTSALQPVAQRSAGVIAIVGQTPAGADGGTAPINKPFAVDTLAQAAQLFAKVAADSTVTGNKLYRAIEVALLQDPKPSTIYAVRIDETAAPNYAAGLASLEALDDVTFVSLAEEVAVGGAADAGLRALKTHCENLSAQGNKRIGVAMIDPATAKSNTYVADVTATAAPLKSDVSRMVLIAARGATTDAATAAMAAMAGHEPHVSLVLKRVRGVNMPVEAQYSPTEIKQLSTEGVIPLIDPSLVVGTSLHFAEGRCFTSDASMLYVDTVRLLDDVDFRLKAGLIGLVGDARITKPGLIALKAQAEGILGPLQRKGMIDDFSIDIPVLGVLSLPESARSPTERTLVTEARANRIVDMFVSLTLGPAIHLLKVIVLPHY
jgi:hypothetical protein